MPKNKSGAAKGTKQTKHIRGKVMTAYMRRVLEKYKGDLVAACREAGYKNPASAAGKLTKNEVFAKHLADSDKIFVTEMAKAAGQEAGKWQGLERGERRHLLAKIARDESKATAARVAAILADAELAGDRIKKFADVSREFDGRTAEELDYYGKHGYWPTEHVEPGEPRPSSTASGSPPAGN